MSLIEHDEDMPKLPDGSRAEILLNSLGVLNRMNPSQLAEQHINFMSDHVLALMKEETDYNNKFDIYMSYLKEVDKEQYDFIDTTVMHWNRAQRDDYIDDIEEHGIFVHQAPFFGNTTMEQFKKIRKEHPEWCTRYKCEGIETPLVIGDVYFIRLKHESSNKCSFVSSGTTNTKNQPAKSNLKKSHKTLFQNTPIALGRVSLLPSINHTYALKPSIKILKKIRRVIIVTLNDYRKHNRIGEEVSRVHSSEWKRMASEMMKK